jgi:hypothetical protein
MAENKINALVESWKTNANLNLSSEEEEKVNSFCRMKNIFLIFIY